MDTFGFIGAGNMGGALAAAVSRTVGGENVFITDIDLQKAEELAAKTGAFATNINTLAEKCDFIFLGVKPQVIFNAAQQLSDLMSKRKQAPVIVTMAAGISIESLGGIFGPDVPIIRIMPNMPARFEQGMIVYTLNQNVTSEQKHLFLNAMQKSGVLDEIPENLIDAAGAVSGCGPAFAAMFIEALADGAVACGLSREKAYLYSAQTVLGSACAVIEGKITPAALKDAVCSPGGTTIEGVYALEKCEFRAGVMQAVIKALEKTNKLKK